MSQVLSYRSDLRKTMDELYDVAEECSEAGWDGFGGLPISQDAYVKAYQFLEDLPTGVPQPSVVPEPDGHICLEWYVKPTRILSVSVAPEPEVHYTATLGPNNQCGTETFFGEIPATINSLIARIYR